MHHRAAALGEALYERVERLNVWAKAARFELLKKAEGAVVVRRQRGVVEDNVEGFNIRLNAVRFQLLKQRHCSGVLLGEVVPKHCVVRVEVRPWPAALRLLEQMYRAGVGGGDEDVEVAAVRVDRHRNLRGFDSGHQLRRRRRVFFERT